MVRLTGKFHFSQKLAKYVYYLLGKEVVCSIHRESIEVSEVLFCLTEEESKYIQHTHKEMIYTMHFCDLQESYCLFGLV